MSAPSKSKTTAVAEQRARLPRNKKELLALLNDKPAPEDIVEQARKIKESVLMDFGLGSAITASVLFTKCHHHIPTTAIETMAVMLLADGTAVLMYNPYFTVALGEEGAKFVLFHESRHLVYRHLFNEPQLRQDPVFTLACELGINHDTMARLKRSGMPKVAKLDENGQPILDAKGAPVMEPTGIDPKVEYDKYAKDLKAQNLTPVAYADFVRTDFGCYTELKRMKNPPVPPQMMLCMHGEDGEGDAGQVPMDDETATHITEQALRVMMQAAAAGKEKAREEMLELAERTEGTSERTSKMWGDMGIGRLRGQTHATRRVDWWKQWFNDQLASRLKEGDRLVYNKKRGALDIFLGNDPMLGHRGDEEEKLALIAIDTSGSMPQHVIDYLTKLVGFTDGVEFRWLAFDGAIEPFRPGEVVKGGGGTNFGLVMDYAEGRLAVDGKTLDIHPDVIVMLTDGYASPIRPAEPDKWVWMITEGGSDDWLRAQPDPMSSHKLTTGDGA